MRVCNKGEKVDALGWVAFVNVPSPLLAFAFLLRVCAFDVLPRSMVVAAEIWRLERCESKLKAKANGSLWEFFFAEIPVDIFRIFRSRGHEVIHGWQCRIRIYHGMKSIFSDVLCPDLN
jgi:hypothetical protein